MSLSKFATMEDYYKHRAAELEKQNAELLEALERLVRDMPSAPDFEDSAVSEARALIAKHGGGV